MNIREMIDENPQKLIDDEVPFVFVEVEGSVRLIDGTMAGSPWCQFEFLDGPFKGKKPYCNGDGEEGFEHFIDCSDDGMVFNPTEEYTEDEEVVGGDAVPELVGLTLTIPGPYNLA